MKKIKVLIVDDNTIFVETFSDFLRGQADFEVIGTAANGKDGIEKITPQNEPDAIILDHVMPLYDGKYFLVELAKLNLKKRPIIIMSSDYNLANINNMLSSLGVTDFIAKPFDYEHIAHTIKMLLGNDEEEVIELMELFDITRRGTLLIKKSIELAKANPSLIFNIPHVFELLVEIYSDLDLKKVRWNIDKTIERTWLEHKKEIIKTMGIKNKIRPNLRAILDYYLNKHD